MYCSEQCLAGSERPSLPCLVQTAIMYECCVLWFWGGEIGRDFMSQVYMTFRCFWLGEMSSGGEKTVRMECLHLFWSQI